VSSLDIGSDVGPRLSYAELKSTYQRVINDLHKDLSELSTQVCQRRRFGRFGAAAEAAPRQSYR
jgi:hypothetical protein